MSEELTLWICQDLPVGKVGRHESCARKISRHPRWKKLIHMALPPKTIHHLKD